MHGHIRTRQHLDNGGLNFLSQRVNVFERHRPVKKDVNVSEAIRSGSAHANLVNTHHAGNTFHRCLDLLLRAIRRRIQQPVNGANPNWMLT